MGSPTCVACKQRLAWRARGAGAAGGAAAAAAAPAASRAARAYFHPNDKARDR
jgi:hypothetical protein